MKINGREVIADSFIETVVIPKGTEQFVFRARPLTSSDIEMFNAFVPYPTPPTMLKPGKDPEPDLKDVGYLQQRNEWAKLRTHFTFLMSLSATDGLDWDTVHLEKPETWGNIQTELDKAGFSDAEINAIFNAVISANGLDGNKIERATADFLATRALEEA